MRFVNAASGLRGDVLTLEKNENLLSAHLSGLLFWCCRLRKLKIGGSESLLNVTHIVVISARQGRQSVRSSKEKLADNSCNTRWKFIINARVSLPAIINFSRSFQWELVWWIIENRLTLLLPVVRSRSINYDDVMQQEKRWQLLALLMNNDARRGTSLLIFQNFSSLNISKLSVTWYLVLNCFVVYKVSKKGIWVQQRW